MTSLGNPFDTMKSFCPYTMFPPKYFDNFSPEGRCSEHLDALRFFLNCLDGCSKGVDAFRFFAIELYNSYLVGSLRQSGVRRRALPQPIRMFRCVRIFLTTGVKKEISELTHPHLLRIHSPIIIILYNHNNSNHDQGKILSKRLGGNIG